MNEFLEQNVQRLRTVSRNIIALHRTRLVTGSASTTLNYATACVTVPTAKMNYPFRVSSSVS